MKQKCFGSIPSLQQVHSCAIILVRINTNINVNIHNFIIPISALLFSHQEKYLELILIQFICILESAVSLDITNVTFPEAFRLFRFKFRFFGTFFLIDPICLSKLPPTCRNGQMCVLGCFHGKKPSAVRDCSSY